MESEFEIIRETCKAINYIRDKEFNHKNDFIKLSEGIYEGKSNLRQNSIRFICVNILNKNSKPRNLNYSGNFEFIIIGDFNDRIELVEGASEALTSFYIETEILPTIRPINEHFLVENIEKYKKNLSKSIIIYDRERNIH